MTQILVKSPMTPRSPGALKVHPDSQVGMQHRRSIGRRSDLGRHPRNDVLKQKAKTSLKAFLYYRDRLP
jgi:hypothetical protein